MSRWRRILGKSNVLVRFLIRWLSIYVAAVICCITLQAATAGPPHPKSAQHTVTTVEVSGVTHSVHQWRFPKRPNDDDELLIVAIEIPSGKYALRILNVQKDGVIQDMLKAAACKDAFFLTNGGFYLQLPDGLRKPLGLAISDGVQVSPFSPRQFGGFLISNGSDVRIIQVDQSQVARRYKQAVQSTPILIREGRNDMRSDDGVLFDRIAIGRSRFGGVLVVGAFKEAGDAISLFQMAEFIMEMGKNGGPVADDILALDGGPSANLVIPKLNLSFGYSSANYLPNAICVGGAG